MMEYILFQKFYFRINTYFHVNFFKFGLDFSSQPVEFYIHNGDERNEPEETLIQGTGINIWAGVFSIHFGLIGKEVEM